MDYIAKAIKAANAKAESNMERTEGRYFGGGATVDSPVGKIYCEVMRPGMRTAIKAHNLRYTFKLDGKRIARAKLEMEVSA